MKSARGMFFFLAILLCLDFYFFQALKTVTQNNTAKTKNIIYTIYWGITVLAVISFFLFGVTEQQFFGRKIRTYLFSIVVGLFIAKFVAMVFFLADDIRRLFQYIFTDKKSVGSDNTSDAISRSTFMSWLGIAAGGTIFGTLLMGFKNQYHYEVRKIKINFANLPAAFKGLKIIHISDIHSGSFMDKKSVEHGINLIMEQQADLILFTGDLVNNEATEMDDYKDIFSKLKAPMGVFSTLGNHDYGDYVKWPIKGVSKVQNLLNLQKVHADMGWRLLMNEHVALEKNGEKIALLGIENWSAKARFPKHGKMNEAYAGAENYPFKILMSHDPSHWDAQVRPQYQNIDLMLSGHTHGMQFGVELPGFKWSPVQYMYPQWGGLYEQGNQKLYVNRGFGFLGYPGRVGIMPEITLIELA